MLIHYNIELKSTAGTGAAGAGKAGADHSGTGPGKPQPERSRSGYPWGIWGSGGGVRKCPEYSQKLKRK